MVIWDIYIRIFHWALALSVTTCFVALELNDMNLHMRSGSLVVALIMFRVLWGFFGSQTARFKTFVKGPSSIIQYLKAGLQHTPGHSPIAAVSVVVMLSAIGLQVSAGLFSSAPDSFIFGPLAEDVSPELSKWFTRLHDLNGEFLKILIAIHILAIVFYRLVKNRHLTMQMMTGRAQTHQSGELVPVEALHFRAAACILCATALTYFLVYA